MWLLYFSRIRTSILEKSKGRQLRFMIKGYDLQTSKSYPYLSHLPSLILFTKSPLRFSQNIVVAFIYTFNISSIKPMWIFDRCKWNHLPLFLRKLKWNDCRIRPIVVRLWDWSLSRRLSQSLTNMWTSRKSCNVGVKIVVGGSFRSSIEQINIYSSKETNK